MRSLEDTRARWHATTQHLSSFEELKQSVKKDGDDNPCMSGLRSVCWKAFLLFQNTKQSEWPQALADSRSAYSALRSHLLRFTEYPDEIGSALDPLDDDKNSPWNTLRQDEEMRAEIFQDVERCMPEEPFFRRPETQKMLLDILFVFCKINQDVGYRQGMHEVLAPILWVVEQDSIDITNGYTTLEDNLKVMLDQTYIEHDAFTLLSLIMRSAKSFYELGEPEKKPGANPSGRGTPQQGSPIVERSKRIHEDYLGRVDPELAKHLSDIEILPQIFLIRWIRLIFGREFPFDELLGLWDILLAEDPGLELVDLVCVAMLLRIRWELLDSNYSFALMLLLKYPAPKPPNGPKSFVDDAIFLRDNFNAVGGSAIVKMYSGRTPKVDISSRPLTPADSATSPRQRLLRTKSPLPSPARFLQQQGSVGELFQGAAKGLLDRSEKLGINQAVRDAVEEAKKNMQTLQASRSSSYNRRTPSIGSRWSLDEGRSVPSAQSSLNALNTRNQQLAHMLDQAMSDLRATSISKSEDKEIYIKAMDLAIAKVEFVKVYLEDATLPLQTEQTTKNSPTASEKETTQTEIPVQGTTTSHPASKSAPEPDLVRKTEATETRMGSDNKQDKPRENKAIPIVLPTKNMPAIDPLQQGDVAMAGDGSKSRPSAPLPTRSSIAQSNFAWMLEPDDGSNVGSGSPPLKSSSPFLKSARKPTSAANREKSGFLFGDDSGDADTKSPRFPSVPDVDEGFDMGKLRRGHDGSQVKK